MSKDQLQTLKEQIDRDREFLEQFIANGSLTADEEAEVVAFRAEIEAKQVALNAIVKMTRRAKDRRRLEQDTESTKVSQYIATKEKIGWLAKEETVGLAPFTSPSGKKYWFADITGLSNATEIDGATFRPQIVETILERVRRHIGVKLDNPDLIARDLRPLEDSPTRDHTKLNPYKDDNINAPGFNNNSIRVLVLEDPTTPEPTFLIASICMHEHQEAMIYGL